MSSHWPGDKFPIVIAIWLLSFIVCTAAIALSFAYADLAIASYHEHVAQRPSALGDSLGSAVILAGEAMVLVGLAIARLLRGKLPPIAEAWAVACLASICAYGIDSAVLKVCFGVPTPYQIMHGAKHAFNLWQGSPDSSFPSGHMTLAGAFGGVFMRIYRVSIWPLSIALLLACILLIVGGWHFLSDVIAGTFLGVTAGLIAGELLKMHGRPFEKPSAG